MATLHTFAWIVSSLLLVDTLCYLVDTQSCHSDQYRCSNGVCIPRSQVCDHYNDCGDQYDSDENPALCSSDSDIYCWDRSFASILCIERNTSGLFQHSFLENDTAIYIFTAPTTYSQYTYLTEVGLNVPAFNLSGLGDKTVMVSISSANCLQTTRIFITDFEQISKKLRVPLHVESEETIRVTIEYFVDIQSRPAVPVNVTCNDCVDLYFRTHFSGCECFRDYAAWRTLIAYRQLWFNVTCSVPETNEIFFSLYDRCLGPPSFEYISPDVTSFLNDEIVLSCVAIGDVAPVVKWVDEEGNVLNSSLNGVYLKTVVTDFPQRFRCVLDDLKISREVTVAKWGPVCEDIYNVKNLRYYRSAPKCYSSRLLRIKSSNFSLIRPVIAHHLTVTHLSPPTLHLKYDARMRSFGNEYLLFYDNQKDGHGTVVRLNDTAEKFDVQLVPPAVLKNGSFEFTLSAKFLNKQFPIPFVAMSAELSVIDCQERDSCDEFFREWTRLETAFVESSCGNGLQQEYLSYLLCRESTSDPGPVPVVSSSARHLIEAPNDLLSNQPFPVVCPIENAASYDWYRINSDGRRKFVTNGCKLIFPSFEDLRDQGAYICVGRGRSPLVTATAEHRTVVLKSGITTLAVNLTLKNETFTDDLSNTSSIAFSTLKEKIRSQLPLDVIYTPVIAYDVVRFYPGSVIVGLKVILSSRINMLDADSVASLQMAISSNASSQPGLNIDPLRVTVVSLSSCPVEVIEIAGRDVTFPQTRVGQNVELLEECIVTGKKGVILISRTCEGDFTQNAHWLEPVLGSCNVNVTGQLDDLKQINVTSDNVEEVAESLYSITSNSSPIDDEALSSVADVLDNILHVRDPSPEVTLNVVSAVNNILQVGSEVFEKLSDGGSTSRIVQAVESQISHVLEDGANFTAVRSTLAVAALNIPPSSLGEGVGFVVTGEISDSVLTNDSVGIYYGSDFPVDETVQSSIRLPGAVLRKHLSVNIPVPISFVVYQSSKLFHSTLIDEAVSSGSLRFVGSAVISATVIGVSVDNLPEDDPVVVTFQQKPLTKGTIQCVFWDSQLQGGVGDWSTEGCRRHASSGGRTVCHCSHTTSFAVLVDIHGQRSPILALDIISKIGCALSIASLVCTIIIYLAIKSLRAKTPSRILVCFCLTLLCLYLVFLVGVEQTSSRAGCIIAAVLLHYLSLASMAWMSVEATNLYLKLVKIFNSDVKHFMIKAGIAAWGLPMIVVSIILAVDYTVYENETSCFLKPSVAFYYGQLLMIGLVFLYNAIIFVLVARRLTCKADKIQSSSKRGKRSKIAKRLQNMVSVSVLLGLTWAFGLLAVIESSTFAFQILFCVFNSLQGLFIFLLFVVRQDKIRSQVLSCFRRRKQNSGKTTDRLVLPVPQCIGKQLPQLSDDDEPKENEEKETIKL
ncbi:uncharacterized protein LOC110975718 [Acanthaster planci]|uniref:Uncharacterized protein LOC110975718 n=1 Tax=Acanthaster planci TaxID=133434 RepID=A0A8B7XVR4_ACAPL|nr:uncharacterized protein LOC110975718 [Acanthaster planci]